MVKLLFVCLGNICRSPSAENIMRHLIEQAGLSAHIHCDSAGTSGYHGGHAPDRRMTEAAQRRGINLVGQARQLLAADLEQFDLILAMDRDNYNDICALDRSAQYRYKVHLMCEFCTQHTLSEVPDPYYGGPDGFDLVLDLLMDACTGLLDHVAKLAETSGVDG